MLSVYLNKRTPTMTNIFYQCLFSYLLIFSICRLRVQSTSQACNGLSQYASCSTNSACGCFHSSSSNGYDICGFRWLTCSDLVSCIPNTNVCFESDHVCVHHPECHDQPLCYPLLMASQQICPPISSFSSTKTATSTVSTATASQDLTSEICLTATWSSHGITVAGGKGFGSNLDQLADPYGIFLDNNDTVYIADRSNHRIVVWEQGASIGRFAAGVKWENTRTIALNMPQDLVVDKNGTMFITDGGNWRVQKWPQDADEGETIMDKVQVVGIAQDDEGSIYVSEYANGRLTKLRPGETIPQVIPTRLHHSNFISLDQNGSIYIVGYMNHRVVKVTEGVEEPEIAAGRSDNSGNGADQLAFPTGVAVDHLGTVYVADTQNHRIMRWPKGSTTGSLLAGGHGAGSGPDELNYPSDLSFDQYGNLYVTDTLNNRVQKFIIDKSSCH